MFDVETVFSVGKRECSIEARRFPAENGDIPRPNVRHQRGNFKKLRQSAGCLTHRRQCLLNSRQHAFFAEDLEQMIEAGAGGFASHGQTAGMLIAYHAGVNAPTLIRRKPGASGSPCIKPSTLKW